MSVLYAARAKSATPTSFVSLAVTAAGSGCQAALDAEWYLRDTPGVPVPAEMPAGDPATAQWAPMADSAS